MESVGAFEPRWLEAAARVAALCDALRGIPAQLEPRSRAKVQAVREQISFGWGKPRGGAMVGGKYECDGWWSEAAAELVLSGRFETSKRQLARDHVWPVSGVVHDLLAEPRTPAATATLLEDRLVTCTLLTGEHARLRGQDGWSRYDRAAIRRRRGLVDGTGQRPA